MKNHRKKQVKSLNGRNNHNSYVKAWTQINQRQMGYLQLPSSPRLMTVLNAEDVEEDSIQQQLISIYQAVSREIKARDDN